MADQGTGREKRKSPRIDFNLGVKVKGNQHVQMVKNFGLYGVFLATKETLHVEPGDEISLVMKFPNEKDAIEVTGEVVHSSKSGVGVAFPEIPAQAAMCMEACFNIFRDTLPMPEKDADKSDE